MSTETKTVEAKVEAAVTQPKEEQTSSKTVPEVDFEAELRKKDAELAEVREERENYRKGMLKAKGKLPDEDDTSSNEDESLDAKIDRKVQERLLSTREAQIQSEKDALVTASAKKIKELTLALKNRGQILDTSGTGSNEDKPEVKVETILSERQLQDLKSRGWDEKKIEEFKKNLLNPQTPKK